VSGRTVMVRGLPPTATAANLESLFGRLGPLRRCFVVTEKGTKTCRGFGYVTFSLAEDAQRALREVTTLGGHQLGVTLARQRLRERKKKPQQEEKEEAAAAAGVRKPKGPSRKARLIVRNLSFKCSEEDLRALFSPFGTVLEVNIPRKPDGKMRGFAFVQLQKVLEAAKALRGVNMKEIKGRPVAVDWAVAKDKYRATQEPQPQESKEETTGQAEEQGQGDGGEEEEQEEEEEEDDEEEEEEEEDEEEDKKATKKMKRKKKKFSLPQAPDSSEEEEEEEEEEGASKEEESSEEEEEEDEDEEEEEEEGLFCSESVGRGRPPPSDVGEGRTVFIRNLSFDTEEEALGELLQQFGALQYVRVVLHPDTEHSKGCAFAQFQTQEAAQKCLQAAQEESEGGGLRLDGRLLRIDLAVSREEARKLRQQKPQKPKGTRNLYLAREGLIRAGTKAAEGVSDSDMAKRARFEELKHQKLRDQNIFVSRTRLCVHNLPKAVDSSRLRRLLLSLGPRGGSAPLIKECRVMREQRGQGHSLGYAFVEFGEHQQALAALRSLNNNPHVFGAQKVSAAPTGGRPGPPLLLCVSLTLHPPQLKLKPKQPEKEPEPTGDPQKNPQEKKKGAKGGQEASPAPPGPPSGAVAWSGFQTEPVPERMQLPDGTHRRRVLALPSHRGPKIRKRDRAQLKPPPPKQPKAKARAKRRKEKHQVALPQAQRQRRGGPGGAEARFNELVERYKRKILGSDHAPTSKRSKWFES
ncbi:RBM28 protein, partial [Galbula dea]|nr:RBM28 protein [Galbula dea]